MNSHVMDGGIEALWWFKKLVEVYRQITRKRTRCTSQRKIRSFVIVWMMIATVCSMKIVVASLRKCGVKCVDLSKPHQNCEQCGTVCVQGKSRVQGKCAVFYQECKDAAISKQKHQHNTPQNNFTNRFRVSEVRWLV